MRKTLTVKDLIERLSAIENKDLEVYVRGNTWWMEPCNEVIECSGDGDCILLASHKEFNRDEVVADLMNSVDKNNGLYYGNKTLDTEKIILNREKLSSNEFVLGESGGGKGFVGSHSGILEAVYKHFLEDFINDEHTDKYAIISKADDSNYALFTYVKENDKYLCGGHMGIFDVGDNTNSVTFVELFKMLEYLQKHNIEVRFDEQFYREEKN